MNEQVMFGVLGPLVAWRDAESITPRSSTHRMVLGVLLLAEDRRVPPERMIDLIWGDDPPSSGRSWVHVSVSRLRTWLEHNAGRSVSLEYDAAGYRLRVPPDAVDLTRFRGLLAAAQREETTDHRLELLEEALGLWRGPVLADNTGSLRRDALASGIEHLRLDAACGLADAALAASVPERALGHLDGLASDHPLDERLHASLALLLAGCGRQADALSVLEQCRKRLADELGIDPGEALRDAHLRVLRQRVLPSRPAAAPSADAEPEPRPEPRPEPEPSPEPEPEPSPEPSPEPGPEAAADHTPAPKPAWRGAGQRLTAMIGRDRECGVVKDLLRDRRLLTILGPGGCGKTTLASHVARELAGDFADGVVFVALAPLTREEQIIMTLGSVLQVTGGTVEQVTDSVRQALAAAQVLLVLDNCEHLAESCAELVQALLGSAPRLVVLATSRQPLGVVEEVVWPLDPLELPTEGEPVDPGTAAVALFMTRARDTVPALTFPADDVEHVARICRRLDGLPLALELAAARVRALPVRTIADRLEESLGLLEGARRGGDPRHRTLQSAIDWSYQLLDDAEARLLARLSVFHGGFTVEAAEAVCCSAPLSRDLVLPTLADLVDRSLVQSYDVGGKRRYRLLEAVREFALSRLEAFGERAAVQDRHMDRWLVRARELDAVPAYSERCRAAREMAPDLANIQAVLDYGHSGGRAADASGITARLFEFWLVNRSFLGDGEGWLRRAAAVLGACPPDVQCMIRFWTARLAGLAEDYATSRDQMAQALPDLAVHRPREHREASISVVTSSRFLLDPSALARLPAMFEAIGSDDGGDEPSTALTAAGGVLASWGHYDEATRMCDEYAARAARRGTPFSLAQQVLRVEIALGTGDHEEALAWSRLLSEQLAGTGSPIDREPPRRAMALVYLATGRPELAAEFLTEAITEMQASYPASMTRDSYLKVLLAEAHRRTGELGIARMTLLDALSRGLARTYFRVSLTGVLVAALLATDLGDTADSRQLAADWDDRRRRIGLPVPVGFIEAAATELGLEPAAPRTPDPRYVWSPGPLRELIESAQQWCVSRRGVPPAVRLAVRNAQPT